MKKKNYIAPQTMETEIDLEGFLCASIVTLKMNVEVDEYVTLNEEVVEF